MGDSQFTVLVVCTANYCRSPMAEQLLSAEIDRLSLPWVASSAGTRGYEQSPMHPFAEQALLDLGCSPRAFASRPVTMPIIKNANLILTASRDHRAEVVRREPKAVRRTFTLRQFARLCSFVPDLSNEAGGDRGARLLEEAHLARSQAPVASGAQDDLTDPMGGPLSAFRDSAAIIRNAVADIVRPVGVVLR